ncbi:hypothetical protein ACS0TY_032281 [Phlomoides rotata]
MLKMHARLSERLFQHTLAPEYAIDRTIASWSPLALQVFFHVSSSQWLIAGHIKKLSKYLDSIIIESTWFLKGGPHLWNAGHRFNISLLPMEYPR